MNKYKSEDRTSTEPTSKPFGGELKLRARMLEIELTFFYIKYLVKVKI